MSLAGCGAARNTLLTHTFRCFVMSVAPPWASRPLAGVLASTRVEKS
jgi:hypothetical protein